ncbi:MAG: hypothetical protein CHACPFDD_03619 [Phycisphaerae bacterium]|nr:hypothetical protein [Phycisphaerae bacterium]
MLPPLTPPQQRAWRMSDGYEIQGRWWPGSDGQRVVVIYLHGIQSHGGWYQRSASLLASTGLPVLMPDRRGSGLNPPPRGDTPAMQRWLDDLSELADGVTAAARCQQVALVGVSWGGKPACVWAMQHPQRCASLALIAPGLFPQVDIGIVERLRVGWSLISEPEARFAIPLQDPRLFTSDTAAQRWIEQDALKLTHVTGRFLYESRRLDRFLAKADKNALPMPIWLALAGEDRIIRNDGTRDWVGMVAPQTLVTEFTKAHHTLEFDAERERIDAAWLTWARSLSSVPSAERATIPATGA